MVLSSQSYLFEASFCHTYFEFSPLILFISFIEHLFYNRTAKFTYSISFCLTYLHFRISIYNFCMRVANYFWLKLIYFIFSHSLQEGPATRNYIHIS